MLTKYFAANQFEVTALHCGAAPLGQRAAMWLMAASDHVAFGPIEALEQAARGWIKRNILMWSARLVRT